MLRLVTSHYGHTRGVGSGVPRRKTLALGHTNEILSHHHTTPRARRRKGFCSQLWCCTHTHGRPRGLERTPADTMRAQTPAHVHRARPRACISRYLLPVTASRLCGRVRRAQDDMQGAAPCHIECPLIYISAWHWH